MSGAKAPAPLAAVGGLHRKAVFSRRVLVLAERLARLLPPGPRLLDVGCGDGSIARALADRRPDLAIEGYDVLARPNAAIPVTRFDGTRLPVPDGAADAVLLVDVLHHAGNAVLLLRECARVAPIVIVKDHLADSRFQERILRFMDWFGNAPHGVVLPYRYFSTVAWADAVSRAGLRETLREEVPGLYPFPFSILFGGKLQFIARLQSSSDGGVRGGPADSRP
jgi:SAM-dependent methyltransferase